MQGASGTVASTISAACAENWFTVYARRLDALFGIGAEARAQAAVGTGLMRPVNFRNTKM